MWKDLFRRTVAAALLLLGCALLAGPAAVRAQGEPPLVPGTVYWYAPSHEKYSRTAFFSGPSFSALPAPVTNRTQELRFIGAQRGWAHLELGAGAKVYLHVRVLRNMMYSPGAVDPWSEFQRSSVFPEHPDRIEADLNKRRTAGPTPTVPGSKRPRELWSPKTFGKAPVEPRPEGETDTSSASGPAPGASRAKGSRSIVKQPQPEPEPPAETRPAADPDKPAEALPR